MDVSNSADLKQAAALDAAADQLILRAAKLARPSQPIRDPSRSAGAAELINHLLITTDGDVPAALTPGEPRQNQVRHRELAHHTVTSRHAELEAGH